MIWWQKYTIISGTKEIYLLTLSFLYRWRKKLSSKRLSAIPRLLNSRYGFWVSVLLNLGSALLTLWLTTSLLLLQATSMFSRIYPDLIALNKSSIILMNQYLKKNWTSCQNQWIITYQLFTESGLSDKTLDNDSLSL